MDDTRRQSIATTWISGGSETCPWCMHRYVYEQEMRCTRCDEPCCPGCVMVIRERHEVLCPDCAEAAERDTVEAADQE
jgi:hypothetical protein